jgi:RHH-type proline utilization regulon transcriptional repressor/proline dehydrogenase/delta 1-pyrroline-5-carboxylate dehydrogenase
MAEPVRKALLKNAGCVRLYAPYGEMVPGMAYLVRRLLENTANESFLRQCFVEGAEADHLLENPEESLKRSGSAPVIPPKAEFANEPLADFTRAELRRDFPDAIAAVRRRLGITSPLHLGGQDVFTADRLDSINPANPEEVIGRICQAGEGETDAALQAAADAFPAWRDTPIAVRAEHLQKAARAARERIVELGAWQVLEAGKQWDQAYADVGEAVDFFEYYAAKMVHLAVPRALGGVPGETNQYSYEPRGVAVIIAPWNFPLAISAGMCAAALVAGNTVVYTPSSLTAVIGYRLLELFQAAGILENVFNYLPGRGSVIGDRLVDSPLVSIIGVTGSMEVGLRILERAAKVQPGQVHVKRVVCEMGGKNAIIVDDDADLDEAVPAVLQSAFGYQGQKCSACSRVIVLEAAYDRFTRRLAEGAGSVRIGPAEDPANFVGPVIDASARRRILEYIEIGKQEGRLLYQSAVPSSMGFYVPITIFEGIRPEHRLAQEEIFGPVLSVMRAADFDQALAWDTSTRFALTGGIFSRSPRNLERARREFRVGNLYVNRGITGALVERQPFGGVRLSGGGTKAGGPDYLLHFLDPRVVTENTIRRGFTPEAVA